MENKIIQKNAHPEIHPIIQVLQVLMQSDKVTRKELVEKTGLPLSSVDSKIQKMRNYRWIVTERKKRKEGGYLAWYSITPKENYRTFLTRKLQMHGVQI